MSRIFWDTPLFIYLFDGDSKVTEPTRLLRERMLERGDELVTSTMTLAEVQVGPRRAGRHDVADRLRDLVRDLCTIVPFDEAAADLFAKLRTQSFVKPADAIQLSCAGTFKVEIFVTNDLSLTKLKVDGVHFVTALDRVPI